MNTYDRLKQLKAIDRNTLHILQGDLAFIVAKTDERTGWYQKLRCNNGKINYVKLYPKPVGNYVVYSQATIEKYNWSTINDGFPYVSYVISGGENVAKVIHENFNIIKKLNEEIKQKYLNEIQQIENNIESEKEKIKSLFKLINEINYSC